MILLRFEDLPLRCLSRPDPLEKNDMIKPGAVLTHFTTHTDERNNNTERSTRLGQLKLVHDNSMHVDP